MKEGASVADHVNEFNSIISRLMSVDIKFDDEVQALLLLSLLPESWSGTVTTFRATIARPKEEVNLIGQFDERLPRRLSEDTNNEAIDGRGQATCWHQRLGHMSEKGMKILASKGRILDLQKAVVGFCEPCVLGKQKKDITFKTT
ncbi:retrovirus-related pol polyprotein from transposon TNT 1-94 [Tanacetum coccineum]